MPITIVKYASPGEHYVTKTIIGSYTETVLSEQWARMLSGSDM